MLLTLAANSGELLLSTHVFYTCFRSFLLILAFDTVRPVSEYTIFNEFFNVIVCDKYMYMYNSVQILYQIMSIVMKQDIKSIYIIN